jgi:hypothetical protein
MVSVMHPFMVTIIVTVAVLSAEARSNSRCKLSILLLGYGVTEVRCALTLFISEL